jgi:hypothetical protein
MTKDQVDSLIDSVRRIAYGGTEGPTGLEALSMSLVGPGTPGDYPLSYALRSVGENIESGLRELAAAQDRTAAALEKIADAQLARALCVKVMP